MKKMRRLIPAIAMLLVSAVMLSTASFAWFTMNETVKASGMEIQAKSSGSLVIGTAPLTSADIKTTADLTPTTVEELKPITYNEGWKTFNGEVDPFTGLVTPPTGETATLKTETIDIADNEYFVDTQIYIGSAGDAQLNQQLTINLSAISGVDELASKAYAVAAYVYNPGEALWASNAWPGTDATPVAVLHVDGALNRNVIVLRGAATGSNAAENGDVTTTYAGYTIPSIVGITGTDANGNTSESNKTGLKVVLRFFVDGDLQAVDAEGNDLKKNQEIIRYVAVGTSYTPIDSETAVTVDKKYDEDVTYYSATGEVMNTASLTAGQLAGTDDLPATWCIRVVQYQQVSYKYVNSAAVPTVGTALSVSFTAVDVTTVTTPAQPQG